MVKLYVEGGGQSAFLRTACREGFTQFVTKAGVLRRPRVVACGSRQDAYDSYCTAIAKGEQAMLLVDSEDPVSVAHSFGSPDQWLPWAHLSQRDNWEKPEGGRDVDCHLMVQVMESWLLADRSTLEAFFDQGFSKSALPAEQNPLEMVQKLNIYAALKRATANCKTKASYGKGDHSFKLLAKIDPQLIINSSPWAARFVKELKER